MLTLPPSLRVRLALTKPKQNKAALRQIIRPPHPASSHRRSSSNLLFFFRFPTQFTPQNAKTQMAGIENNSILQHPIRPKFVWPSIAPRFAWLKHSRSGLWVGPPQHNRPQQRPFQMATTTAVAAMQLGNDECQLDPSSEESPGNLPHNVRYGKSLSSLTRKFVALLQSSYAGVLDLKEVNSALRVQHGDWGNTILHFRSRYVCV